MKQIFFVGSYTAGDSSEASGQGIYTCTLESLTGRMQLESCFKACRNPSYLALDEENRRLFAVEECSADENPAVCAFSIGEGFALEPLNSRSVPGGAPCYLALNADKRFLTVANYSTGNVLLYPLSRDGVIGNLADDVYHTDYYTGRSVNPDRQEAPHPHATVFGPNSQTVYVPDLGTDEIVSYRLGTEGAKLEPLSHLKMPAGVGPRHLVFHPEEPVAFVLNELASSLGVLRCNGYELTLLSNISTLPAGFQGENTGAAVRVHTSGNFVYASNRGDDSVAVFSFERAAQRLHPVQHIASQGQMPRDFALDPEGKLAVVANQRTSTLVSFWLDDATGKLEPTGFRLDMGTPVCVAMTTLKV